MTSLTNDGPTSSAQLRPGQTLRLAVMGAILWALAAGLIHIIGPMGAFHGAARALLYAATVPVSILFLRMPRWVGARADQIVASVAVMAAAASMLDGLALAWAPGLYGFEPVSVFGGAALLLWAVGVALALSLAQDLARSRSA